MVPCYADCSGVDFHYLIVDEASTTPELSAKRRSANAMGTGLSTSTEHHEEHRTPKGDHSSIKEYPDDAKKNRSDGSTLDSSNETDPSKYKCR